MKRQQVILLGILFLLSTWPAIAREGAEIHPAKLDDDGTTVLFDPGRVLEPEVIFLKDTPVIDGKLDETLTSLPVHRFSRLRKSNPENPDTWVNYRLAYGTHFLYLFVEAEAAELRYRDRAFQNGDGFEMVIAKPQADDEPTDEFYVLSCSAVNKPDLEWTRNIFRYYNVTDIFVETSPDTRLEFHDGEGVISFELLLPWKDIHPYHPWLSETIGFNLRFVRAIGERDKNYYKVFPGTIGDENSPRWYGHLRFQSPAPTKTIQTHIQLDRRNTQEGNAVHAIAATIGPVGARESLTFAMSQLEGKSQPGPSVEYACGEGITRRKYEAVPADLPSADYVISWNSSQSSGTSQFTVLPSFDPNDFIQRLARTKNDIPAGSYTTLEYSIQRTANLMTDLRPYEVASFERISASRVGERLAQAEMAEDPYDGITMPLRRAFRSELDGTLQPYVVVPPNNYDPNREYPLIVYLHGSASNEADIVNHRYVTNDDCVAIGPFGRGPSNGFATNEAQVDIAEAIADAKANYSIKPGNTILTGFSMGGYGVYRTYWENPKDFKALAVFSGGISFGRGSNRVDFLKEDLHVFKNAPVFIYHGKQDRNVSYDKTVAMVERLRATGVDVELHSESNRGHREPGDETKAAYQQWLRGVIEN